MEWELFIGRFHPLIVHLPIGFIFLGFFFELLNLWGKEYSSRLNNYIFLMYSAGWLLAVIAIITGLMLSGSNEYGTEPLEEHKLFGILTVVFLGLLVLFKWLAKTRGLKLQFAGSMGVMMLIGLTGHLGGTLTHGKEYLYEYAPSAFKSLVGYQPRERDFAAASKDSVIVYRDFIQPVLSTNCIECHNDQEAKGGFDGSQYKSLFKEAEHKMPIIAGKPYSSELFVRISLPSDDKKFMPLGNNGIGYTNLLIVKYWIETGADSISFFESEKMSEELMTLLVRDYGLDYNPKPYYERTTVQLLDKLVLTHLNNMGFLALYLSEDNFYLDVSFRNDTISNQAIQSLSEVKDHITFLDLSKSQLTIERISALPVFSNLTRIDLNNNPINDSIYNYLNQHENLESINLHSTGLTNAGLEKILASTSTQRIYVWNTQCSEEYIEELRRKYHQIEIVTGFTFDKSESATDELAAAE